VDGSWGGDFFGRVRPQPEDPIVTKHRYSGFHNTELDTVLRVHGIRTLIISGVATNVCVATTAHDGFMRDYYIVLVEDGTASYTQDEHEAALDDINRYLGEVTNIAAVTSIWHEQSAKNA
jgi:ureidoacrylate peracid hydrolase